MLLLYLKPKMLVTRNYPEIWPLSPPLRHKHTASENKMWKYPRHPHTRGRGIPVFPPSLSLRSGLRKDWWLPFYIIENEQADLLRIPSHCWSCNHIRFGRHSEKDTKRKTLKGRHQETLTKTMVSISLTIACHIMIYIHKWNICFSIHITPVSWYNQLDMFNRLIWIFLSNDNLDNFQVTLNKSQGFLNEVNILL